MKLTKELKARIDNYFGNITSAELYEISVNKYGFAENTNLEIDNQSFATLNVEKYISVDNGFDVSKETSMPFAA
ncbi:hypothetical protein [Flavobacterium sp. 102]|uniref:hypothetical protein n=1 Tax=Flavobacterium sp. 102 TaxID=2135623 RepID=UPI000EB109E8|nr:hypothetical protein [Flavobacterium sp. 102]RKS02883.1 hypothetical protein C8C84_2613 [Flavobacterium sp. 102]